MAQNSYNKNTTRLTIPSHSKSITTIPNKQKNISLMPKFLLKTLHRRKPSHQRSVSNSFPMNVNKNLTDHGAKNEEKIEKVRWFDKQLQRHNHLVTSTISALFRNSNSSSSNNNNNINNNSSSSSNNNNNNKWRDHEQCKDHKPRNLAKQVSKKSGSNDVSCNTYNNYKFGVGNVANFTANGGRISRVKSVKNGDNLEEKRGLKIKRIIKLKSREGEKRLELCKMKILMGEKCRPLHGSLRYDKNGVLVPEDFI